MRSVFFLRHLEEKKDDGAQGHKTIGAYSTFDNAREAMDRLREKPGFKDFPDRWAIEECCLDLPDDWSNGFDPKTHAKILPR
ncbi:MAG: hypothetical protein JSR24_08250 [Proteobacteria bacterium]|nr:hypothetical protein [Pseudomonadota bacterium]